MSSSFRSTAKGTLVATELVVQMKRGQLKQGSLYDFLRPKQYCTSVITNPFQALTCSEASVSMEPQLSCSSSHSDDSHVDGKNTITSQDLFCTPDYITPPDCHNFLNVFSCDQELTACPKAPDKMCTNMDKRRRLEEISAVEVGRQETDQEMASGSDMNEHDVLESALSIRCRSITPHCYKNPFLEQTSRNYSDPLSAEKSKCAARFPDMVGKYGMSQYRKNFYEIEKIGEGNFNTVFMALNRIDGILYAIKHSTVPLYDEIEREKAMREVWFMAALGYHENIVQYLDSWFESDRLYIKMELCDHCLSIQKSTNLLTEDESCRVIYQIARALKFLHGKGASHMDIKPANIYIKNDVYKLGDFGCATFGNQSLDDGEGDGRYIAPETMNEDFDHLDKGDVFSLGVSIYELMTGSLPRESESPNLPLLSIYSSQFQSLLRAMLEVDPIRRPSAEEILKSSVFVRPQEIQE